MDNLKHFRTPPSEKKVAQMKVNMEKCLQEIEDIWLQGENFTLYIFRLKHE